MHRVDELREQKQYRAAAVVAEEAQYMAKEWLHWDHPEYQEAWESKRVASARRGDEVQ